MALATVMWLADAVAEATAELAGVGVESPRADAELLAAFVLDTPRTRLPLSGGLTPDQRRRYRQLVRDRCTRVPLQHLTGRAPFRYLDLAVGPGVFIPRPETESLVEWGLWWLRQRASGSAGAAASGPAVVVDLCAGSGAIAASIAAEAPRAGVGPVDVWAVERDPAAVIWLRRNVARHGVNVVVGDATDPLVLAELDGDVDLVLANPPYVPAGAAATLPPEVTRHDPPSAVFAGDDGLVVIGPLLRRACALLRTGGAVGLEHDETQVDAVWALAGATGCLGEVAVHHDLAGRPRFTVATRLANASRVADWRS